MKKGTGYRWGKTAVAALLAGVLMLGNGQVWKAGTEEADRVMINTEDTEEELQEEIREEVQDVEDRGSQCGTLEDTEEEVWISEAEEEADGSEAEEEAEESDGSEEGEEPEESETPDLSEDRENPEITDPEDTPSEEIPEEPEIGEADFVLTAEVIPETARAGEILLYMISAENTGEVPLEYLNFETSFGEEALEGSWETPEGQPLTAENTGALECGENRSFYLKLPLPEDRRDPVTLKVSASAGYQEEEISRQARVTTEITPLKADFTVTKTADRSAALSGDQVFFQICIRNTGERTLHSVLTTERMQTEGIPVEFVEKEGVILNHTKTKALISRIEPGHSFSLQAAVTIPEKITVRELVNQVEVVTKETGERTVTSEARVQVYREEAENTEPEIQEPEERTGSQADPVSKACPVSSNPRTGDDSKAGFWTGISMLLAAAAGALIWKRCRR